MSGPKPRVLLVEGDADKRLVPYLVEANGIDWGKRGAEIVHIQPYGGVDRLTEVLVSTHLKASGLLALGILIDANESPSDRWRKVRQVLEAQRLKPPPELPPEGLVLHPDSRPSVGVWMMPDNSMRGMLETFLASLVPGESTELLAYAAECCDEATKRGAPFIPTHLDKARIHNWLAWQNPPGVQLHEAVKHRVLEPTRPPAQRFMNWFRELYGL